MSKMLETTIEIVQDIAKKFLPSIYALIKRSMDFKSFSLSYVAHYSRRFGFRAIIIAGGLASIYAVYLFAMNSLAPESPKASHDVILKTRFSSPKASANVLILDIDERTLAALSEKYGRWPWSRDVLADGLQKVTDLGARAILFNVMLSDPDKANPDADSAMQMTAQLNPAIAFPLIRLNPKNDTQSSLKAAQIPGAVLSPKHPPDKTIAVILPMFTAMHDRLGIANQNPDADGIVRKYPLRWQEDTYKLPSMVQQAVELGGSDTSSLPDDIHLNWRNKQGRYNRISFSDLFLDKLDSKQLSEFKNAYVVLSLSAPGLGQTKPTSVMSVEDDGEILATAIDDSINDTYLRTMPLWVVLILNLMIIWSLVWLSIRTVKGSWFNRIFIFAQSGLGGITLLSASYTCYLIDLSDSMSFGLSVFAVIKLIQSMDDRWSRAKPGFRKLGPKQANTELLILGYLSDHLPDGVAKNLQKAIEEKVGLTNVIRIDDLFAGESFLKSPCARFRCLIVNVNQLQASEIELILALQAYENVLCKTYTSRCAWDTEDKAFGLEMASLVLENGAQLIYKDWDKQYPATPAA